MAILPKKPSSKPTAGLSKGLDVMKKGLDKSIAVITKLWGRFSEMIDGLNKKYLAPLMAPLTGWLNDFAGLKLPGLDKKRDKDKKNKEKKESREGDEEGVADDKKESPPEKKPGKPRTKVELAALMGKIETEQKPLDHTKIKSFPFEKTPPSEKHPNGVTLCAKTANLNLHQFGFTKFFRAKKAIKALSEGEPFEAVGLPAGHAHDIRDYYIKSNHFEKFVGANESIMKQLEGSTKNVAHLVVKSRSKEFSHSAIAFRSEVNGKWYILDPYFKGERNTKEERKNPISFEDYKSTILIAVPLSATKSPSEKAA